ncbi:PREDICTED: probable myosin-binding protein 5 [Tarenaya hassleriana]|uniref:probable myosin-binding protein 5 n=1 Tax=Tarenaya hassleriana TaxID=28532 RepID=UPI00053C9A01|nr:PREDICTED: probable myosin-binding protein 5 [Tarenaya hassleriana]
MPKRSFKNFVEQELGRIPQFVIFAFLEWILIAILFIDGFLAFLSNEFARFFELKIPCLLCTRIDHVLVRRNPDFYYNSSICDSHKKKVSSLAYCHIHKKLSEIKHMCEGCLLSFATEKESDTDTYKSLIGILHKDLELLIDDEREFQLTFPVSGPKKEDSIVQQNVDYRTKYDSSGNVFQPQLRCSCCGELLKASSAKPKSSFLAPTPSPRVSFNQRTLDMSHVKYTELNKFSDTELELPEDEDSSNTDNPASKEDIKGASVPLLADPDEPLEERTPSFVRGGNKFFGIPLSDSAQNSPRWSVRPVRKSFLDKTSNASENADQSEAMDGDYILQRLKRQVRLDRKSLIALYMELDEERSASAVAANNAMAMITRLQAEKAALQMDALQYQRMMEEQAEYDQEALQSMNNMLAKREDELKDLDAELEAYRQKYRSVPIVEGDDEGEQFLTEGGKITADENDEEGKPVLNSPDCCSSKGSNHEEEEEEEINGSASSKPEETSRLGQIEQSDETDISVHESTANNGKGNGGNKEVLVRELSEITERLNALEAGGDLLKHISEVLDVSEGEAILFQISQNLHMLRSFVAMPPDA